MKCFLCKSSETFYYRNRKDAVTQFTKKSFEQCFLKLAYRKFRDFKYGNAQLREDQCEVIGYHPMCYKKITDVKKMYHADFDAFVKMVRLPNDMRNYMQYRLTGSVSKVFMESSCLPTKFHCQSDKSANPIKRPNILKKRRKTLTEESEKNLEESSSNSDVAYIRKPIEYSEETDSTEATAEDSIMTDKEYEIIGKSIGLQLRDLSKRQLTITQKIISDAIYYAKMGALTERSGIALEKPNSPTGEPSKDYHPNVTSKQSVHAEASSTSKSHDSVDNSSNNESPQHLFEPQSPQDSIVKIEYEELENNVSPLHLFEPHSPEGSTVKIEYEEIEIEQDFKEE